MTVQLHYMAHAFKVIVGCSFIVTKQVVTICQSKEDKDNTVLAFISTTCFVPKAMPMYISSKHLLEI